jgi:hypothetical protein
VYFFSGRRVDPFVKGRPIRWQEASAGRVRSGPSAICAPDVSLSSPQP